MGLFAKWLRRLLARLCELFVLCEKLNLFVGLPLCHAELHSDGQKQSLFDLP
jgi:hypothetical protein